LYLIVTTATVPYLLQKTGNYFYDFYRWTSTWVPPKPSGLENWIDYASDGFAGGTGSPKDPYLISTPEQLAYLAKQVNMGNYIGSSLRLSNNIDLAGKEWTPIGNERFPFQAFLHGNGATMTIRNLTIHSPEDNQGLFGTVLNASLRDLALVDADVQGKDNVGGLMGVFNYGGISQCSVSGRIKGRYSVGGLIGVGTNFKCEHSVFRGNVSGHENIGGIIGAIDNRRWIYTMVRLESRIPPTPELFAASAIASINGEKYVGGLVGKRISMFFFNSARKCFFMGKIQGEESVAGLCGGGEYLPGYGCLLLLDKRDAKDVMPIGHFRGETYVSAGYNNTVYYSEDGGAALYSDKQIIPISAVDTESIDALLSDPWNKNISKDLLDKFRVFQVSRSYKATLAKTSIELQLDRQDYELPLNFMAGTLLQIEGDFLRLYGIMGEPVGRIINVPSGFYLLPCISRSEKRVLWILLNVVD
jgi:hypothetical protein